MNKIVSGVLLASSLLISGCATPTQSLIISIDYNDQEDITTFSISPDGDIRIPGKWNYNGEYRESSQQHFLRNDDSTLLTVAKIPLNRTTPMSDWGCLKSYYKWEADYFEQERGVNIKIIEEDQDQCLIMYDINDAMSFICGIKGNFLYGFSLQESSWDQETKHRFLKALFLGN